MPPSTSSDDRADRMRRLGEWLDALDAQYGPPSQEAVAEAEAWLLSARPAKDSP